jgi:hypothetical protein
LIRAVAVSGVLRAKNDITSSLLGNNVHASESPTR